MAINRMSFNDNPTSYMQGAHRLGIGASLTSGQLGIASMCSEATVYNNDLNTGSFYQNAPNSQAGTPPTSAPSVPLESGVPTSSVITVQFNAGFTGGSPRPVMSILYGTTPNPTTPYPAVIAFGSLYTATLTGLPAGTTYYFKSVATNVYGQQISNVSPPIATSSGSGVAPSGPPTVPAFVSATSNSITVSINVSGITGNPAPTYGVFIGKTANPTIYLATQVAGPLYQATATGLTPGTTYFFQSVAQNGVSTDKESALSGGYRTSSGPSSGPLNTNVVTPFLIQGPRFGSTPGAWAGIDYYINSAATGAVAVPGQTAPSGAQLFGNMYGGTVGAPGNLSGDPGNLVPYAGSCVADVPFNYNFGVTSDAYLTSVQTALGSRGRVLTSWGGFYADILGQFGPYQPTGYPGTNPSSTDVVRSFLYNYCGITEGNTNPLNWRRTNSTSTSSYDFYYEGLVLDFENVGQGDPLNSYPNPPSSVAFPANATNPTYSPYIAALAAIPSTYYGIAPTLFLGNAPVSLSLISDVGTTNICAANSALNTWYAFPTATVAPTVGAYNDADSLALNHPEQMSYMDDIFVQFYNESADYYPGGQYFANLLACWGVVALKSQAYGRKKTKINLGLSRGNIIAGGNPYVAAAQGPTPQLNGQTGPPYTYWYPQYCATSPPNNTSNTSYATWPNTGPTKDPANVALAISQANSILQVFFNDVTIVPSTWLSGMGFWAGSGATLEAQNVYTKGNSDSPGSILPALETYCWGDATYPAPNPLWPGNVPIVNSL